jgi:hypothetical protein
VSTEQPVTDPAVDLAVWLPAQIDEDERTAPSEHFTIGDSEYHACPATRSEPFGDLDYGEDACDCGLKQRRTRELREVAAKRRVLDRHRRIRRRNESGEDVCEYCSAERIIDIAWPCADVLDTASVYAGRDGYREEWRP